MNVQPVFDTIDWMSRTAIVGPITWMHLFLFLVLASVGYNVWRRYLGGKDNRKYMVFVRCNECSWLGKVSKFSRVCGKCKSTNVRMLNAQDAAELEKSRRK